MRIGVCNLKAEPPKWALGVQTVTDPHLRFFTGRLGIQRTVPKIWEKSKQIASNKYRILDCIQTNVITYIQIKGQNVG